MTDEEIRKLAQSYVDELFYGDDMSDQENIENKNDALVLCMAFAGHILERHCIVEKEKVNDFWDEITTLYLNGGKITYDGARFMFRSLFGKELFNDTEK